MGDKPPHSQDRSYSTDDENDLVALHLGSLCLWVGSWAQAPVVMEGVEQVDFA